MAAVSAGPVTDWVSLLLRMSAPLLTAYWVLCTGAVIVTLMSIPGVPPAFRVGCACMHGMCVLTGGYAGPEGGAGCMPLTQPPDACPVDV